MTLRIERIECSQEVADKLERKHGIRLVEVEAVLQSKTSHLRKTGGIYELYGQSYEGRYLFVVFRNRGRGIVMIITARDMTTGERRLFKRASALHG